MRVLVCGGRNYGHVPYGIAKWTPAWYAAKKQARAEILILVKTLNKLTPRPTLIIHGAANGADDLARLWAKEFGVVDLPFKANWYPNGRKNGLDRRAGPLRNARMLDEGKPDLVVAFPGGKGTVDMVTRAKRTGVQVVEVPA